MTHARALSLAFNERSIPAEVVHGAMDQEERRAALKGFADGVLCFVVYCMFVCVYA